MVHKELKSKDGGFEQDWLMSEKIKTKPLWLFTSFTSRPQSCERGSKQFCVKDVDAKKSLLLSTLFRFLAKHNN